MDASTFMPALLLSLFCLATSIGVSVGLFLRYGARRSSALLEPSPPAGLEWTAPPKRPPSWLVVQGRSLLEVKTALGVANAKPCAVADALEAEPRIFISPPVRGWVLVVGSDLPDPAEDVDACFRFVLNASRRLGHIQFFAVNPVLHHHAWVRADRGRVTRAYAWAGRTLWNQGKATSGEKELDLNCHDYGSDFSIDAQNLHHGDDAAANAEKVALLAARWSLDPGSLGPAAWQAANGLAGEVRLRY